MYETTFQTKKKLLTCQLITYETAHSLARKAAFFQGMGATRCWKHSFVILIHVDMTASRDSCRFFRCTFVL